MPKGHLCCLFLKKDGVLIVLWMVLLFIFVAILNELGMATEGKRSCKKPRGSTDLRCRCFTWPVRKLSESTLGMQLYMAWLVLFYPSQQCQKQLIRPWNILA